MSHRSQMRWPHLGIGFKESSGSPESLAPSAVISLGTPIPIAVVSSFLLLEDGVSHLLLENGTDALLLFA